MQRKTLKDVQIDDTIYSQKGGEKPVEWKVIELSTTKIKIGCRIGERVAPRYAADLTSFKFTAFRENDPTSTYYQENCFVNKLDAIKAYRKHLDSRLRMIFEENEKFLKNLQDCNKEIREYDDLIIKESLI